MVDRLRSVIDDVMENFFVDGEGQVSYVEPMEDISMGYRLMDTLTCVQCGKRYYRPSLGKSSRSFNVQCEPECEGVIHEASAKAEQGSQRESVSKGKSR